MDSSWICSAIITSLIALLTYFLWKLRLIDYLLYKIEEGSSRHGGELVAEVLKAHNVRFLFTLCGGHISPILVAAEKVGIRVVDVRHEVTSVFAADAVARLSGSIGVAAVTAGPGLTNTVTAVKNAQMAESPILLLGGAAAGLLKGRGALQDIDQMALFRPLCKFTATVSRIRDIVPILRRAIQAAMSGTPGPVFVEFPIDTLYPYHLVKRELGVSGSSRGLQQRIVNIYLQSYLFNLFADAFSVPRDPSPLPVRVPLPSSSAVGSAMKLIATATRPILLLGSQVTLPPKSVDEIADAVRTLGVPCYLGGMSRGLLGRCSDLQFRQNRREALKEADVIILAGSVCDFRLGYGRVLNRSAAIIAINRDKDQLYKNSDMFWKPRLAIQADVGSTLVQLATQRKTSSVSPYAAWIEKLRSMETKKERENREKTTVVPEMHLNPLRVLHQLEETGLTDSSILVADGGDFVGSAAYILRPRGPLKWLDPGAFGTLGVGAGFALGAKLCRPECDVWIIYGDGSFGYSASEFDTYVRHHIPIIALVGNDACWSQIARDQVPMFGSNVGCELEFTHYDRVAEGFGGRGFQLNRDNASEMTDLFGKARQLASEGQAVLINCLIGKSDFRAGSISV